MDSILNSSVMCVSEELLNADAVDYSFCLSEHVRNNLWKKRKKLWENLMKKYEECGDESYEKSVKMTDLGSSKKIQNDETSVEDELGDEECDTNFLSSHVGEMCSPLKLGQKFNSHDSIKKSNKSCYSTKSLQEKLSVSSHEDLVPVYESDLFKKEVKNVHNLNETFVVQCYERADDENSFPLRQKISVENVADERETVSSYKIASYVPDNMHLKMEDVRSENLFTGATDRTYSSFQVLCSNTNRMANSESDCSSKENNYNYSARKELDVRPEVITTISTKTGMLADLELENECEMNVNRQYDVSSKNKGIKELDISNDIIIEAATDSKKRSNCTENTNKFQNERMSRVQMLDSVLSENHVIEDYNSDCDIFDKPGKTRKVPKFIQNVNCCIETEMADSESDCSSKENKYNYSARKELDVRPEVITTISTKTGMLADLECEMNVNGQYDVSSKNKGIKELDISNDIIIEAATDSKKRSNCTKNTNKFQNERMSREQMLDSVLSENHVIEDYNSDCDIFDKPGKTRKVPKFIQNVNCCIETEMANSESDCSSKENKYNYSARKELDVCPEVITTISTKTGMLADLELENEYEMNVNRQYDVSSKNKGIKELPNSDDMIIEAANDSKKRSNCTKNTNKFQNERMSREQMLDSVLSENHVIEDYNSDCDIFDKPGKTRKVPKFIQNVNCCIETEMANSESDCSSKENKYNYSARKELDVCPEVITTISTKTGMLADLELENEYEMNVNRQYDVSSKNKGIKELPNSDDMIIEAATDSKKRSNCTKNINKFQNERMSREQMLDSVLSENHVIEDYNSDCDIFDKPGKTRKVPKFIQNVNCCIETEMADSESDCSSKENKYNYSGRKELNVRPEVITTISTKTGMLADLELENEYEMNVNGQHVVSSKNKGIKELDISNDIIIEAATDSKKRSNCTENTNKFQNKRMSRVQMLDSVLSENHVMEDYNSDCDIFDKPGKTRKVSKFIQNVNCCIETEMENSESDCSSKENKYNYRGRKELNVRPEVITTISTKTGMLADLECEMNVNGQYDVSSKNKGIKELDISNDIIIEAATDSKKRSNCTKNTNKFQNERMSRVQMLDSVLSENHVIEDYNSDCDIFDKPGKTRKVPKFIQNVNCCIETEMADSESDCSSKENKYNYSARKELDVRPEVITTISTKTGMLADLELENEYEMNVNRQYDVSSKNKGIKELPNSDDMIIEAATDSKKRSNCTKSTNKFQNKRMSRVQMLDSVLSENHVIEDYNSDCDIFDKPGKTRKVPKFIQNVNCCIETEMADSESDCSSKENKYNYSARKELDVRPEVITTISTKTGMLADLELENEYEMNVNRQYDVSSKNKGIKELPNSDDMIIEAATDSKKRSNCTKNTNKFQNKRMSRVQMLDSVLSENHVIEDYNSDCDIFDKPGKTRKVPKFIQNVNCCIETEMADSESDCSSKENKYNYSARKELDVRPEVITTISTKTGMLADLECEMNVNGQYDVSSKNKGIKELDISNDIIIEAATDSKKRSNCTKNTNKFQNKRMSRVQMLDSVLSENHVMEDYNSDCDIFDKPGKTRKVPKFIQNVNCCIETEMADSESDCSSKENKYNYSARKELDVRPEVITTISTKTGMLADLELENKYEMNVNGQYDVSSKNKGIKELPNSDDMIIEAATDSKKRSNCTKNTNKFQNKRMSREQMLDSVLSENHVMEDYNSDCDIFDKPGKTRKVPKFIQNVNCCIETEMADSESDCSSKENKYNYRGRKELNVRPEVITTISTKTGMLADLECEMNVNGQYDVSSKNRGIKELDISNDIIIEATTDSKKRSNCTKNTNKFQNKRMSRVQMLDSVLSENHVIEDYNSDCDIFDKPGKTRKVPKFIQNVNCCIETEMADSESDCSSKENKYNYRGRKELNVRPEVITTISTKTGMLADLELENKYEMNVNGQYDISSKNKGIKELPNSDDMIIEAAKDSKKRSNCTENTNKFQNERMSRVQMLDSVLSENHVIEDYNSDCDIFDKPGKTRKVPKFIQNVNCCIETEMSKKSRYSTLYSESENLPFRDKYVRNETVSGSSVSVFEESRNCGEKSNCIEIGYSKLKNSRVINNSQSFRSSSLKKFKSGAKIVENEAICDTSRKHKEEANLTDYANELENVRIKRWKPCDTLFVRETKLSKENEEDRKKLSVTSELGKKDNRDEYVTIRTPVEDNFQYKRKRRLKYSFYISRK